MNSPFAAFYLELLERFRLMVPDVRYINLDIGQLEDEGLRPAVSFPCVLLDFEDFTFTDMGENLQIGEGNLKLRIAFAPFSNAGNLATDAVRQKALSFFETEWNINKVLHGWEGEIFGALVRSSANTEKRDDNLRVREVIYSTTFQDNSTGNEYSPYPNPLSLVTQIADGDILVEGTPGLGQTP